MLLGVKPYICELIVKLVQFLTICFIVNIKK